MVSPVSTSSPRVRGSVNRRRQNSRDKSSPLRNMQQKRLLAKVCMIQQRLFCLGWWCWYRWRENLGIGQPRLANRSCRQEWHVREQYPGIMNQFSLSWVPYGVSKLAALAQALVALSSPSARSACLGTLSSSSEQAWSSWARLTALLRVLPSRFLADLYSLISFLSSFDDDTKGAQISSQGIQCRHFPKYTQCFV